MKLMQGSGALELTVKASASAARSLFDGMSGIVSVDVKKSGEADACDIAVQTEADTDIREQIFYRCAERRLPVLRMQQSHVSLEEIFLELTGEESVPEEQISEVEEGGEEA